MEREDDETKKIAREGGTRRGEKKKREKGKGRNNVQCNRYKSKKVG